MTKIVWIAKTRALTPEQNRWINDDLRRQREASMRVDPHQPAGAMAEPHKPSEDHETTPITAPSNQL